MGTRQYLKTIIIMQLLLLVCFAGICLAERGSDDEISLLWPVEDKRSFLGKFMPRKLPPRPPAPEGFAISPREISGALSRRKHIIYIYADSKDYYVLRRQPAKLSMVKEYGFRIDGNTGQAYPPENQEPNRYSLPRSLTNGFSELELKIQYGTEADKLEARLYEKVSRYLHDNDIAFSSLAFTVEPHLKKAQCQISGPSKYVPKSERQQKDDSPRQPIKGQLKIKYIEPQLWEISGTDDLKYFKTIYGTAADRLEKKFHEEISKSLKKSNIRFNRIHINIRPDLSRARCSVEGIGRLDEIEGKESWQRLRGHIRAQKTDQYNWQISGTDDIEHIKLRINVKDVM